MLEDLCTFFLCKPKFRIFQYFAPRMIFTTRRRRETFQFRLCKDILALATRTIVGMFNKFKKPVTIIFRLHSVGMYGVIL